VPPNFAVLILEKYRDFGSSIPHREAFLYFTNRVLPSVNASITKFERLKYQKTISECFSYTDEAFALLMVVNYEARWTSQYEAIAGYPAESRKIRAKRWKDVRYTSSTEGCRRGQSWTRKGLLKFNSLCEMVKTQRAKEETGSTVENYLRTWCRDQAGMHAWRETTNEGDADPQDALDEEEEQEVEAVGECDIYQV
jgi:hypothetical protein